MDRHILYLDRQTIGLKMTILFNLCIYLEPNKNSNMILGSCSFELKRSPTMNGRVEAELTGVPHCWDIWTSSLFLWEPTWIDTFPNVDNTKPHI